MCTQVHAESQELYNRMVNLMEEKLSLILLEGLKICDSVAMYANRNSIDVYVRTMEALNPVRQVGPLAEQPVEPVVEPVVELSEEPAAEPAEQPAEQPAALPETWYANPRRTSENLKYVLGEPKQEPVIPPPAETDTQQSMFLDRSFSLQLDKVPSIDNMLPPSRPASPLHHSPKTPTSSFLPHPTHTSTPFTPTRPSSASPKKATKPLRPMVPITDVLPNPSSARQSRANAVRPLAMKRTPFRVIKTSQLGKLSKLAPTGILKPRTQPILKSARKAAVPSERDIALRHEMENSIEVVRSSYVANWAEFTSSSQPELPPSSPVPRNQILPVYLDRIFR